MNYEQAADRYMQVRKELDALDREYKERKAAIKEKMITLENWFTAKAQEDGLSTIKTNAGTAYWSTHHSATVGSREDLFNFCKDNNAWDLLEARASKTAVRSYIEASGEPPPGVNFKSVSVFNFRKSN
jgi:ABC-type Zn uptake system ZnuABC Zn-binding protein ZnuA